MWADNLVPDEMFDMVCREIDLSIPTDRPDLDEWFKANFDPSTGLWIHKHPELERLKEIYSNLKSGRPQFLRRQAVDHQPTP